MSKIIPNSLCRIINGPGRGRKVTAVRFCGEVLLCVEGVFTKHNDVWEVVVEDNIGLIPLHRSSSAYGIREANLERLGGIDELNAAIGTNEVLH